MPIFDWNIKSSNKENVDTGFSNTSYGNGERFLNRDGSFNIKREGVPFFSRFSTYNFFLELNTLQFVLVIIGAIFMVNLFFTWIYFLIGFEYFAGLLTPDKWGRLKEIFYFSSQTFSTVGYGRINPVGDAANIVASFEAVIGFLSFALITGLVYGRFTKPKADLIFSKKAIIAPYHNITSLMLRFAAAKDTHTLSDVLVKLNLGMQIIEDNKPVYKFFELNLERTHIENLAMNFTVVHPIDENSPLWQFTEADYELADAEFYVLVRAFDDVYSSIVQQRTSYIFTEIIHGVKYASMYKESEDGKTTILEMQHLNKTIPA